MTGKEIRSDRKGGGMCLALLLTFAAVFALGYMLFRYGKKKEADRKADLVAVAADPQLQKQAADSIVAGMVRVDGGTFTMGVSEERQRDASGSAVPAHEVTLQPFYIGRHEVTQRQWAAIMGTTPAYHFGADWPVDNVSWNDCQAFISKLNRLTGRHFRLPTEAEWEYAAKGGSLSHGYKYAGGDDMGRVGWYSANSTKSYNRGEDEREEPRDRTVGQKKANELGLYDMSGNVEEWCADWYAPYSPDSTTDPTGPESGTYRVMRGGTFSEREYYCEVTRRRLAAPDYTSDKCGFRLAASDL